MIKVIRLTLMLIMFISLISFAEAREIENLPTFKTPQQLSNWLMCNFKYHKEIGDHWQSPEETLQKRSGDCEDFAILVIVMLKKMGIKSDMVILTFRGLSMGHVICIWKDCDGIVNFISNRELVYTRKTSIEEAVKRFYPDCNGIIYNDNRLKRANRRYNK